MKEKSKEKQKAIELRKQGLSYREILEQVSVAKSSLSLWLKSVKLGESQKQRLTEKKLAFARRGAQKMHAIRIALTQEIKDTARKEVGVLSKRELWLIGVALYWAEGSKEKPYHSGARVVFTNSDPFMVRLFLDWLVKIVKIERKNIYFSVYIHESRKNDLEKAISHWSKNTNFPKEKFGKVYFKKNKIATKRKNIGENYFGLLRVMVKNSSELNRRIQGWVEGICIST